MVLLAPPAAPRVLDAVEDSLLAAVVSAAPLPLWVIGPDGTVIIANPAATEFLGYRDGLDVVGGPSHDLLHSNRPDGSVYLPHECPIVRSHGSHGAATEWFLTRHGDLRPVSWSARPLGNSGMTLLHFHAAATSTALPGTRGSTGTTGTRGSRVTSGTGRSGAEGRLHRSVQPAAVTPTREAVREQVYVIVRSRFTDPYFSATELAAETHLSTRSLQTLFQEVGRSPAAEIRRLRMEYAFTMLERGHTVRSACLGSGHLDPDSFGRAFRRHFGRAPSRVERAGPGLDGQ